MWVFVEGGRSAVLFLRKSVLMNSKLVLSVAFGPGSRAQKHDLTGHVQWSIEGILQNAHGDSTLLLKK